MLCQKHFSQFCDVIDVVAVLIKVFSFLSHVSPFVPIKLPAFSASCYPSTMPVALTLFAHAGFSIGAMNCVQFLH